MTTDETKTTDETPDWASDDVTDELIELLGDQLKSCEYRSLQRLTALCELALKRCHEAGDEGNVFEPSRLTPIERAELELASGLTFAAMMERAGLDFDEALDQWADEDEDWSCKFTVGPDRERSDLVKVTITFVRGDGVELDTEPDDDDDMDVDVDDETAELARRRGWAESELAE